MDNALVVVVVTVAAVVAAAYPVVIRKLILRRVDRIVDLTLPGDPTVQALPPDEWFARQSEILDGIDERMRAASAPLSTEAIRKMRGIVRSELRQAEELGRWSLATQNGQLRTTLKASSEQEAQNAVVVAQSLIQGGLPIDHEWKDVPDPRYGNPAVADSEKAVAWRQQAQRMPEVLDSLRAAIRAGHFDPERANLMQRHISRELDTYHKIEGALQALNSDRG